MTTNDRISVEQRVRQGQSVALGDTGEGETGVPPSEQGISNRPGDEERGASPAGDEADVPESDDAGLDVDDDDDDDDDDDAEDDVTDPEAEPGKPI